MKYEYGIAYSKDNSIHRSGMTEFEADMWLKEWKEEWVQRGGDGRRPPIFHKIRRPIGEWEGDYAE